MAHKDRLFQSKEYLDREAVAQFLRQLADRIDANTVVFSQNDNQYPIELPEELVLHTRLDEETKNRDRKYRFDLELNWRTGARKQPSNHRETGVRLA